MCLAEAQTKSDPHGKKGHVIQSYVSLESTDILKKNSCLNLVLKYET